MYINFQNTLMDITGFHKTNKASPNINNSQNEKAIAQINTHPLEKQAIPLMTRDCLNQCISFQKQQQYCSLTIYCNTCIG